MQEEHRVARRVALNTRNQELDQLSPIERLRAVLDDTTFLLEEYPDEWALLSMDYFRECDSIALTTLIKRLDSRVEQKKCLGRFTHPHVPVETASL